MPDAGPDTRTEAAGDTAASRFGAAHRAAVERLLSSYSGIPAGSPVRLAKKTSNLFRVRQRPAGPGLDVSGLADVLAVHPQDRTVDVGGMCTYEQLVEATLPYGLSPTVVPQLKTITVGGAVTGLGIESASFRTGLVHEAVVEMDVLTGSGAVVTAAPDNEYADLYHGFPNSFGTLGYATRIRLRLEPVLPWVELRHLPFGSAVDLLAALGRIVETRSYDGEPVDYLDGVVFDADECYLTLGRQTDEPGPVSDYTGQQIYYTSIRQRSTDRLTIHDYLWRWDTDWFWCSRAFGVQQPLVRRLWPRGWRRSSVYSRLVALDQRFDILDRTDRLRGLPANERVVQDVEIPLEHAVEFLHWFLDRVPIRPIWLCPLVSRPPSGAVDASPDDDRAWPLYPLRSGRTYVNVGFWSVVPVRDGAQPGETNRAIEAEVDALHGHKSLYSDSFYTAEHFAELYGGSAYQQLKRRYDPANRLPDLYAKAVRHR